MYRPLLRSCEQSYDYLLIATVGYICCCVICFVLCAFFYIYIYIYMPDYACRHNFTWTSCSRALMQQWPPLQAVVLCNRHCARSTCMSYTWRVSALSSHASRPEWSFDDALQGSRKHSGQRVAETRYRYRSWLNGRRDHAG